MENLLFGQDVLDPQLHVRAGQCVERSELTIDEQTVSDIEKVGVFVQNSTPQTSNSMYYSTSECQTALQEKPISFANDQLWTSMSQNFCSLNPEYCIFDEDEEEYEGLDFSKSDLKEKFLFYTQNTDTLTADLKEQARQQIPAYICFKFSIMNIEDILLGATRSKEDKKLAFEELLKIADTKTVMALANRSYRMMTTFHMNKPEWEGYYQFLLDKVAVLEETESNVVTKFVKDLIESEGRSDDTKRIGILSLKTLARNGSRRAINSIRELTTNNSEVLASQATEVLRNLEAMAGENEALTSIMGVEKFEAPKCQEWSEDRKFNSLRSSQTMVSNFYEYMASPEGYGINLNQNSITGNPSSTENKYQKFLKLVIPSAQGESEGWKRYLDSYKESTAEQDERIDKVMAERLYCRMYYLNELHQVITNPKSSKNTLTNVLNIFPFLGDEDSWDLMNYLIDKTDNPAVLDHAITVIRQMKTDRAEYSLEKIFLKKPELRPAVIRAFEVRGIDLLEDSQILRMLKENLRNQESKRLLVKLYEILEKKKDDKTTAEENRNSLTVMAQGDLNDFSTSVINRYISSDIASRNPEETDELIGTSEMNIAEIRAKIAQEQNNLASSQGDKDSFFIREKINRLNSELNSHNDILFEALLKKKINDLDGLISSSNESEGRSLAQEIVELISKKLFEVRSSTANNSQQMILNEIAELIKKSDEDNSDNRPPNGSGQQDNGGPGNSIGRIGGNGEPDTTRDTSGGKDVVVRPSGPANGGGSSSDLTGGIGRRPPPGIRNGMRPQGERVVIGPKKTRGRTVAGVVPVNGVDNLEVSPVFVNSEDGESEKGAKLDNLDFSSDGVEYQAQDYSNKDSSQKSWGNQGNGQANSQAQNESGVFQQYEREQINNVKKSNRSASRINNDINQLEGEIESLREANKKLADYKNIKIPESEIASAKRVAVSRSGANMTGNYNIPSGMGGISKAAPNYSGSGSFRGNRSPSNSKLGSSKESSSKNSKDSLKGSKKADEKSTKTLESIGVESKLILSEEIIGKEDKTVFVHKKFEQEIFAKLFNNRSQVTCMDLDFFKKTLEENKDKLVRNKKGEKELLIKIGEEAYLLVAEDIEKTSKNISEKCSKAAKENTRHTASVDEDLDNLPDEISEQNKKAQTLVEERADTQELGKIIDGVITD